MYLPERLQAKKEDVKADIANKARCKDYSARPTTYGIPDIKKFGMTGLTLNIKSSKARGKNKGKGKQASGSKVLTGDIGCIQGPRGTKIGTYAGHFDTVWDVYCMFYGQLQIRTWMPPTAGNPLWTHRSLLG